MSLHLTLNLIFGGIAIISLWYAIRTVFRMKKQVAEMQEVLEDVKNGNGNRRILAEVNEVIAPLAYEMNDIIQSYEKELSVFHQTEETNKQLMTSLSHDVRTPLTTLLGYLDAACKGIVTGVEKDNYIETAWHKAHDLKDYIDILFDWFKLSSNEFSIQIEKTEIAELTRNILIDWIPILEEKQIDYEFEIPEYAVMVNIDLDGYTRVLNNLIQNVIAHSKASRITLAILFNKENITITVSDNGIGINKEDLRHIFDRLYKVDKGRTKKGSGLGLSIAQQLVEKMGGLIVAKSELGKGTIFSIIFSAAQ
jgi:signal transduction histidine kinase